MAIHRLSVLSKGMRILGAAALLLALAGGGWAYRNVKPASSELVGSLPRAVVHREELDVFLTVGGEIQGGKQTRIDCELQNIPSALNLGSFAGQTIISLIPDGKHVKKGDVLCRFDASSYEEAARIQRIELEKAKSAFRQAELDLDSAKVGHVAYRDGEVAQLTDAFRGSIALMKSDLQRARQKLDWTKRMAKIRYVSSNDLTIDQHAVMIQEEGLKRTEGEFRVFRKYTVPKVLYELQCVIAKAQEQWDFAKEQFESDERRLAKINRQIEACTIRAPHDGMVIHADVLFGPDLKLREGMQVHQGQPMFFLPDLDHVVAGISLHESVAARVEVGMKTRIRMQAFPGRVMTGRVTRKELLPTPNYRAGIDIRHFEARVEFDATPKGVLPDMSTEIEIITTKRKDTLVVASEALTYENGKAYCYVAVGPNLERRAVRVRRAGRNLLEVVAGLAEGEQVLLRPSLTTLPANIPTIPERVETAVDTSEPADSERHPT
jgi:HlyD family secretion protein